MVGAAGGSSSPRGQLVDYCQIPSLDEIRDRRRRPADDHHVPRRSSSGMYKECDTQVPRVTLVARAAGLTRNGAFP